MALTSAICLASVARLVAQSTVPPTKPATDHADEPVVLSPFEVDEDPGPMIEAGADAVELIATEGIDAALAAYV